MSHRRIRPRPAATASPAEREAVAALFEHPTREACTIVCKTCGSSLATVDRAEDDVMLWTNDNRQNVTLNGRYRLACPGCARTYTCRGDELLAASRKRGSAHRLR